MIIVVALTYVLGMANLLRINLEQIVRRSRDWPYKIALVGGCVLTMVVGFFFSGGTKYLNDGTPFSWIYITFYSAMSATMFSLLAFFIASAAFRAFRARNTEAALLLGAAIIVLLGRAPIGTLINRNLPDITNWIIDWPNNAGRRAIIMGAALGAIVTDLRVLLGMERQHVGGE